MVKQKIHCHFFLTRYVYDGKGKINNCNSYDQHYGLWVPVFNENDGKIYMVDTYKIDNFNIYSGMSKYESAIKNLKKLEEKGSWTIYNANNNFYYNVSPELTEQNFDKFELICILDEWKDISRYEFNEYSESDRLCRIKLGREWEYPYGSYLIRKDAKKDSFKILCKMNAKINDDIRMNFIHEDLDEFEKTIYFYAMQLSNPKHSEELKKFKKTALKARKYLELRKEYEDFCNTLYNDSNNDDNNDDNNDI